MFAVGDTGATRTLLTEAARPYRLVELDPQEERVVVYAGGEVLGFRTEIPRFHLKPFILL